jgi:hypothetical protein
MENCANTMANLLIRASGSLPEELLEMIFKNFAPSPYEDPATLDSCALSKISKSCKQFRRIVEPLLYQNVPGIIRYKGQKGQKGPLLADSGLLDTLIARPHLAKYVKNFRSMLGATRSQRTIEFAKLVAVLPNLQYLDFRQVCSYNYVDVRPRLLGIGFKTPRLAAVTRLDICLISSSIQDLGNIFVIPSLEVANIKIKRFTEDTDMPPSHARRGSPKNLCRKLKEFSFSIQELDFEDTISAEMIHNAFGPIVGACPDLKSFSLSTKAGGRREFYTGLVTALSDHFRGGSLQHFSLCCSPVESAVIGGPLPDPMVWESEKTAVETLKLDITTLFSDRPGDVRLEHLLPRFIRELVLYHYPHTIVDAIFGLHFAYEGLPELLSKIKTGSFPALRRVTIEQATNRTNQLIDLNEALKVGFEAVNVKLEVQ